MGNNDDEKIQDLDKNVKEIITKAQRTQDLTLKQLEELKKSCLESVEFLNKLEQINLEEKSFVIYNDGFDQLFYDNGEYFLLNTMDNKKDKKNKKKLKKSEAKDMYIQYYMKYILNPIIKQKELEKIGSKQHEIQVKHEVKKLKKQEKSFNSISEDKIR